MVDVPERIVLLPRETLGMDRKLNDYIASQPNAVEYVRADRYSTLEAEVSRLTAPVESAQEFIGRVSGAALGIAMSGDDHPNPDEVLMDFAHEGMDISASLRAARAFAEKAGA